MSNKTKKRIRSDEGGYGKNMGDEVTVILRGREKSCGRRRRPGRRMTIDGTRDDGRRKQALHELLDWITALKKIDTTYYWNE